MTDLAATRDWYARAAVDLAGTSPLQVSWAMDVAADDELLGLITELPREHRQPSLLFSVAAYCGAPAVASPDWRSFVVANWREIAPLAASRRTQTNEIGRCIPLLLGISRFEGPIALLEVGASAGLCLAVDGYSYRFDDDPVLAPATGPSSPLLTAATSGTPRPSRMPDIVWRAGIDLAPLDVRDADDVRWLEALLPPDRPERLARLRAAIVMAAVEPPRVIAGDALEALAGLAAEAPRDATLVVASLGTMPYLPPGDRAALPALVAELGAHFVAFEPAAAVPGVADALERLVASEPMPSVLSVDGMPHAYGSAHGDRISWLSARHPDLSATPT